MFESWQQISAHDYKVITVDEKVLLIMSWLLATAAIAAIASIAVVVGGRMAEQTRCLGLLKAIGGTPQLVAVLLLAENLLLALAAANGDWPWAICSRWDSPTLEAGCSGPRRPRR